MNIVNFKFIPIISHKSVICEGLVSVVGTQTVLDRSEPQPGWIWCQSTELNSNAALK